MKFTMDRKIIGLMLTVLFCLVGKNAFAYDFEAANSDGVTIYYSYSNDGRELTVTTKVQYHSDYSGNIVIPEEVTYMNRTRKVTGIGYVAFENCRGLTSVTIPNTVTFISKRAFDGCSGLTSITIPNSVTSIGDEAFAGCSGLTSVTIGNSVISLGEWAFQSCKGLTSITIPNSVTTIEACAFEYCSGLTSVTFGVGLRNINNTAFRGCEELSSIKVEPSNTKFDSRDNCNGIIETESNTLILGCKNTLIPNSVTSIGNAAFSEHCRKLTSITIPSSVTSIGPSAFSHCEGLTSITIPNSVRTIGHFAFFFCKSMTSVTFGNNVTSIGDFAFSCCNSLTSVVIPNSVTELGKNVFQNCKGLTSVTIGSNVTKIGWDAFNGCDIINVISKIENPLDIDINTFSDNTFYNATLYVPVGTIGKYKAREGWKRFVFIEEGLPSSIANIEGDGTNKYRRYSLDGKVVKNPHKGINIIQMNDGKVIKVLAK